MSVIRRNIFWLLVSQAATWIATLATLLVVPNKLGSTDFGTYGFAAGFVQFFTLFAGLGTSVYISRAVARDHSLVGSYVWNATVLKVALWVVVSAAAMALGYGLGNRGQTLAIIAISCVGMLPFLLTEVFTGALAGMQKMAKPAMWVVVQVYYQTAFGILVLVLGWGVVAYTIVMTSGILIPAVATAVMVRPYVRGHRVLDWKVWRLLVVGGVPLLALAFLNLIYGTVDIPILHSIVGSDPVGWYAVALRWVGIPVFITTAVVAAYFPAFSQHGNPLTHEFAPLVNRAVRIVLLVNAPAAIGLFFVAPDLIHLFYGHGYDNSIVLVQILAVGIPIMGMDTVLATALVACDRVSRYLWIAVGAAILNPILCVIAVNVSDSRWQNGAIGASVVTVATEVWVMIGALVLRAPGVIDRAETGRIARIALACAAMVPVLLLASGLPLAVQVILGAITYALATLLFGGVSLGEIREIVTQVISSRRGGGPPAAGDEDSELEVGLAPFQPNSDMA